MRLQIIAFASVIGQGTDDGNRATNSGRKSIVVSPLSLPRNLAGFAPHKGLTENERPVEGEAKAR
jgi:hypothetical protein